jgi:hypothetical protein
MTTDFEEGGEPIVTAPEEPTTPVDEQPVADDADAQPADE